MSIRDNHRFNNTMTKVEDILQSGEWQQGDRLPNLTDFANKLNVSVSLIREVFRVLESRNILRIEQGRGTFLNELGKDKVLEENAKLKPSASIIELMNLIQVRSIIEPAFAEIAAQQAYQTEIQGIMDSAKRMEKLVQLNKSTKKEDMYFHLLIVKATHNDVSIEMYEQLQDKLRKARSYTNIQPMKEKAVNYHLMIAEAIEKRESKKAREYMASHMESNKEVVIYGYTNLNESISQRGSSL
ncbi:FadR/GntR family transcriptional regulator [Virgibacillus xinjiangensis]|uniref:FadR/GntR family transcriptional regulator n=1 Tax=Virgibacillus xinjiangensis TaxID=393090 RepID=A0ABV7CYU1_9BACI